MKINYIATLIFFLSCLISFSADPLYDLYHPVVPPGPSINEVKGAPFIVNTINDRNAISSYKRADGMTCWVKNNTTLYRLVGGTYDVNWVEESASANTNFASLHVADSNLNIKINVTSNSLAIVDSNLYQNILITSNLIGSKVSSNVLASTTLGSEGIRQVGALGGYTLEGFIEDTALKGLPRDLPNFTYELYPSTNLVVSYTDGDIYDPLYGYKHLSSDTHTLLTNGVAYAYWKTNTPNVISWAGTRPSASAGIYIATFVTAFGSILHFDDALATGDAILAQDVAFANILPSIVVEGLTVYATGTNLTNIVINGGVEYHNMSERNVHDEIDLSVSNKLTIYTHSNNAWAAIVTNCLPVGLWDNGTNLVACNPTNWYRGVFVSVKNSGGLHWVAPDMEYTNSTDAIAGSDPDLPPSFIPYIPKSTAYVFEGDDISLNTPAYWIDRRNSDSPLKSNTTIGGGSGNTPTLSQVLAAGSDVGNNLPSGMGLPVSDDQAASKGYVDSTINNVNAKQAYVDNKGNDTTALLESSILPFKTIQKAIDVAGAAANETNRYVITISPGTYTENITMSNYVSICGKDIPSTFILGKITYSPSYTDATGSEVGLLSVRSVNTPALVLNAGSDDAYMGLRSCAFYADYTVETVTNKSVVLIKRGLTEMYGTTYTELNVMTTNGFVANAQIFEHTTDLANDGLSQFTSFNSSSIINCADTNDDVSMMFTHDNTDSGCINEMLGGNFNIHLETDSTDIKHHNSIKLVSHKRAIGRSLSMANATRLYMDETNSCNLFIAFSIDGTGDNVAISRNNHIRVVSGSSSNIWFGAAVGTNDNIRVYDTEIIQNNAFNVYPKKYTALGSLGDYYINTPHQNGDHIFGGALDLSDLSTSGQTLPESGHVKMYANTYAGLENVMFQDSSGNIGRYARDNFFNGYNAETTTLNIGEAVYITNGLSADQTPIIRRCDASDPSTLPCDGIVVQVGNVASGTVGRILRAGRTESTFNTAFAASGSKLYVPVKANNSSMVTNVAPTGTNIVQLVGKVHVSGVNGKMTVFPSNPDTLGGRVPKDYVTYNAPTFSASQFMLTNSATAKFSISDIPIGTTNTYILPSVGGTLATYANIQIVPVSAIVGETHIAKGRVVYQSGSDIAGRPIVKYADCRLTANLPVIGVTSSSGDNGDIIEVVSFGPIRDIDTSFFKVNELMYLSTNGYLGTVPSSGSDASILLGTCLLSNSVTGSMLVNIRSYYQDGAYPGSMRYAIKNAATGTTAAANFFVYNNLGEAMRMGIRCEGHQRGRGDFIVGDAGQMIFGNTRRDRFVWSIDMTDSTNIYKHNDWPMMALVPQQVTSNAFLGIGTTNPLVMLDVRGNVSAQQIVATNSYRLSNSGYSTNEHITYGTTTNLIGILSTNLQGQIINNSNITYTADTNLSARINTETNRAIQAEIGLTNAIVSNYTNLNNSIIAASNTLYGIDTNLQNQINNNSNIVVGINTNLGNQISATSNTLYIADTNLSNRINIETNRATVTETNLQGQITSATNRIQNIENKTNDWNNAANPVRFWANNGGRLQTINNTTAMVLLTNKISSVGGSYSNSATVARWTPGVSNVTIRVFGNLYWDMANGTIATFVMRKNGSANAVLAYKRANNAADDLGQTFEYIDVTTNSADYYEIWATTTGSEVQLGTARDNWWAGQVIYNP